MEWLGNISILMLIGFAAIWWQAFRSDRNNIIKKTGKHKNSRNALLVLFHAFFSFGHALKVSGCALFYSGHALKVSRHASHFKGHALNVLSNALNIFRHVFFSFGHALKVSRHARFSFQNIIRFIFINHHNYSLTTKTNYHGKS